MNIRKARRRKPQRLTEFGYSTPDAYFDTLCTKDGRPSPAKIIKLSGDGELANTNPSLPELIRAFKSFSAREINKRLRISKPFWQRGYHEHVIRNAKDHYLHHAYIVNNPLKWALDDYYQ